MSISLPQEIEVWYLIPAIRRTLVDSLINDFHLKQSETAKLLGITEAAVSQYRKSKRAAGIKFNEKTKNLIKKCAKKLHDKKTCSFREIQRLCMGIKKSGFLCEIHKKYDKKIGVCKVCLK